MQENCRLAPSLFHQKYIGNGRSEIYFVCNFQIRLIADDETDLGQILKTAKLFLYYSMIHNASCKAIPRKAEDYVYPVAVTQSENYDYSIQYDVEKNT